MHELGTQADESDERLRRLVASPQDVFGQVRQGEDESYRLEFAAFTPIDGGEGQLRGLDIQHGAPAAARVETALQRLYARVHPKMAQRGQIHKLHIVRARTPAHMRAAQNRKLRRLPFECEGQQHRLRDQHHCACGALSRDVLDVEQELAARDLVRLEAQFGGAEHRTLDARVANRRSGVNRGQMLRLQARIRALHAQIEKLHRLTRYHRKG
jgi:hypothetical protein